MMALPGTLPSRCPVDPRHDILSILCNCYNRVDVTSSLDFYILENSVINQITVSFESAPKPTKLQVKTKL